MNNTEIIAVIKKVKKDWDDLKERVDYPHPFYLVKFNEILNDKDVLALYTYEFDVK